MRKQRKPDANYKDINHGHINTGPMYDSRELALKEELKTYRETHEKPWYLKRYDTRL